MIYIYTYIYILTVEFYSCVTASKFFTLSTIKHLDLTQLYTTDNSLDSGLNYTKMDHIHEKQNIPAIRFRDWMTFHWYGFYLYVYADNSQTSEGYRHGFTSPVL